MDRRQTMNSLGDTCNELKDQYDNCFNAWFSKQFLKGDTDDSNLDKTVFVTMEACKDLKDKYDDCFNNWFSEKFLKGKTDDAQCASFLKVYKVCLEKAMKENKIELHDVQINHLETDKEKTPQS